MLRYIKMTLSTNYVGTDDYRYLHTDMSDAELWEYMREEALSHNESFGCGFAEWMQENVPDTPEDEWDEYWDDYVVDICECCGWEELDAEEVAEIDETYWEEL